MGHQPLRNTEYSCAHWSLLIFTLKEGEMMTFLSYLRENIELKRLKTIFFCVFTFGLVAHGYSFFNGNFSHDSLFDLYELSPDPMIAVGRYFRPVYRLIRGDFALPVISGFLLMLFMALSIYLLTDTLPIRKPFFLILTCGILITNASVTLLNATYIHDADSYGFALLLVVLGIYITVKFKRGIFFAPLLYMLSLGLYQAYINVAIFVFLLLALVSLLEGASVKQEYLKGLFRMISVGVGMALYFIGYKVVLMITGISQSDGYNSVSRTGGLSLRNIAHRFYYCLKSELEWLIYPRNRVTWLITGITVVLMAVAIWLVITLLSRMKSSKRPIPGVIGIFAMIPFGINTITILSDQYHELTTFSLFFLYILVVVLIELYLKNNDRIKIGSGITYVSALLLCIIIFDNCIYSNQVYLKKEMENAATLSVLTRMIGRMEGTEGYVPGETECAIIGILDEGPLSQHRAGFDYDTGGLWYNYNTSYPETYPIYLNYYLDYPVNFVSDDKLTALENTPEVKNMPFFPAEDSVKMVDGVMVVKLSEPVEK